jgi:tRNA(Ile)-lysidine synthase
MSPEELHEVVRGSRLFARDRPVVAMLSGGRDSTCLLDVVVALLGAEAVQALHVNYGLRAEAEEEERRCRALCETLGVQVSVLSAAEDRGVGEGNLQAWAREVRYREGLRLAQERDGLLATGHTADDQVETILYRLAASPGRRALLGMVAVEGRLIRPLLGLARKDTTAYCEQRGLAYADDASNADTRFARARVRHELLPALRAVHPAAESNVLRTAALLREETELLDELVQRELQAGSFVAMARLREMPPALARLVVVRLAEQATGAYVPQAGNRVSELLALDRRSGRAELHVGGRAGAVIEDGTLRMVRLPARESATEGRPPEED